MSAQRVRIKWTVEAVCYPEDRDALLADAVGLVIDGLLGGYALDATIKRESIETFEDEDDATPDDGEWHFIEFKDWPTEAQRNHLRIDHASSDDDDVDDASLVAIHEEGHPAPRDYMRDEAQGRGLTSL